jgi:hypothetical protein
LLRGQHDHSQASVAAALGIRGYLARVCKLRDKSGQ